MGSAVDGERTVSSLPILELNRSMRKSKQYEQTDACSPVNNLTCAQKSCQPASKQPWPWQGRLTCTPAVYQPTSCLPN